MFILQTYNTALMWSRFERMFFIAIALFLIVGFEFVISDEPTWMISSLSSIVAQIAVFKCWADMIFMSQPYKNCWAFKE